MQKQSAEKVNRKGETNSLQDRYKDRYYTAGEVDKDRDTAGKVNKDRDTAGKSTKTETLQERSTKKET